MVKCKEPLPQIRQQILDLQQQVANDPYFADIPSMNKKKQKGGFYFHATDDIPEVRKIFYDYVRKLDCSFEAVVGRKTQQIFETKHNGKEAEFYADLLSHLLKNKLQKGGKLTLTIAKRANSTRNQNLQLALAKAISQSHKNKAVKTKVAFNVQNHLTEPLLNVADYFCWSIQRIFERGETRYYDFLRDKISLVLDLYDWSKLGGNQKYYSPKNPLTARNKL